jgi:eukaryotic-like serine/threonine-protein kinase
MQMNDSAAHALLGETIDGWHAFEKIDKTDNATGSFFSVCYKVMKEGEVCFLKAFDFNKFFNAFPGKIVDVMSNMLDAYKYERDLSNKCKEYSVTKVACVKESGEFSVPSFTISTVPYLIFDLADGDIRRQLKFSENLDYAWRFYSLHEIATGLKQLHNIGVSHQDLKPSNILLFGTASKIGDLGRSLCKDMVGPHSNNCFSGDNSYAPPEIMYNYYELDWAKRVLATDLYLLGSLVVFYFSGGTMSALIQKNLPSEFRVQTFRGFFSEVSPYIMDSFNTSINEFSDSLKHEFFKEDLINIVKYLCFPMPDRRGHPSNHVGHSNKYSLERFISKFDLLHTRAKFLLRG